MAEIPPAARPPSNEIAEQLAKTAADLRTLAEQVGALPSGAPKAVSLERARITFLFVVMAATLIGWLLWDNWHSLLVAFAPLIWIFSHAWRRRRTTRPTDESPTA